MRLVSMKALAAVLLLLLSSVPAIAQSNAEVNAGVQFDFSLPGARSLSLGGAFVALADDATSVWANPAGLTILAKPEVSGEGRFWDFNNYVANRGHDGGPSNFGVDTIAGLVNADRNSYAGALSFISYALPRNRWTLGFYRHQVSSFRAEIESGGIFLDRPYDDRVEPFRASMDLDIADYGASFGIRASEKFSIGATIAAYSFDMNARTSRFYYAPFPGTQPFPYPGREGEFVDSGEFFGPANFTPPNEFFTVTESGTDWKPGFGVGALYRDTKWSVGAVYRFGPTFDYDGVTIVPTTFVPAAFDPGDTGAPFYSSFKNQIFDEESEKFDLPDTLALGFTVRPSDTLVLSFEYDRVWYFQISDNNVEIFGLEELAPGGVELARQIKEGLVFPDVNQFRAGAEYTIVRPGADVLLRVGGWSDPDHRMRFEATGGEARVRSLFKPGANEFHVAPGIGFAFDKFQIDAAVDVSSRVNTLSVSTVYRF